MKRSIRWKFTVAFISLMTFAIVATWCINTFWLEDYYENYKVDVLEQAYSEIDTIIQKARAENRDILDDEDEELVNVITRLRNTSNITLLIYDGIKDKTLVSSARDINVLKARVSQYIVGQTAPDRHMMEEHDNYTIQKTYDRSNKTYFLESWGFFSDNSTIFIMTTPLASIQESAAISNRFLMYVGIAVI